MTSTAYEFGDRVTFTRSLHRHTVSRQVVSPSEWGDQHRFRSYKEWTVERWIGDDNTTAPVEPRPGIIIGKRTLANGYLHYESYEDPITFKPDQHLTAYVIAYDLHRSPVYVLPEHITPAPEETP